MILTRLTWYLQLFQCSTQNSAAWDWKWNFKNPKRKRKIKWWEFTHYCLFHHFWVDIDSIKKCFFSFLWGFSFTNTEDSQDSIIMKGIMFYSPLPCLIRLYHFHSFSNIQTFIGNFACDMTATYFYLHPL